MMWIQRGAVIVVAGLWLLQASCAADPKASGKPTPEQIEAFKKKVTAAWKERRPEQIEALYYFEGTPEKLREQKLASWQNFTSLADYVETTYIPLEEELQGMPEGFREMYKAAAQPIIYNGITRRMNMEPIGSVKVKMRLPQNGNQEASIGDSVGLTPSGELKFACLREDGEPTYKALPPVDGPIPPQPVSPDRIESLKAKVKHALTDGDWRDFMELYDRRGADQHSINEVAGQYKTLKMRQKYSRLGISFKDSAYRPFGEAMASTYEGKTTLPVVGGMFVYLQEGTQGPPQTIQFLVSQNEKGELVFPFLKPAKPEE